MKLVIVSPFGMTQFDRTLKAIAAWGGPENVIRSKRMIVNEELARKHFQFFDETAMAKAVEEWTGTTVHAAIVNSVGDDAIGLARESLLYFSPEERSEQEARLWFPEYFAP